MKLRNKKTGEIRELPDGFFCGDNLKKICEEWEDYEEPKGIQSIYYVNHFDTTRMNGVLIGFNSKEEAEQALEKLKAWKRLKDKGFEFTGWDRHPDYPGDFSITASDEWTCDNKDLNLLFRGKNECEEPKPNIGDLPAFPPESLLTKSKAEELLAEIEKAKNPLATFLKGNGAKNE